MSGTKKSRSAYKLAFSGLLAILLCAVIGLMQFDYFEMESQEIDYRKARQEYSQWLKKHPFKQRELLTKQDLKKIPKKDRPDLAAELNFIQTLDPALGYPPTERAVEAYHQAISMKKSGSVLEGVPGSSTTPWVERGPSNVGGRSRAIMFDPNDGTSRKVWAGGVAGGLWHNSDITSGASTWTNVDDFFDNMAISTIAYDPNSTTTFYFGTGEGTFNVDAVRGDGIWKSTDGGATWAQLPSTSGLNDFKYVQKIVVHPSTSDVYAATRGASPSSDGGVWRSTNGGTTWTKVLGVGVGAVVNPAADLEIAADGDIYASMGLTFSVFTDGIYHSATGNPGSWTKLNTGANGFPTTGFSRIELATAPSDADYIYALAQSTTTFGILGIYKSTNGGTTWSTTALPVDADPGIGADFTRGQAWYDLIAKVSPTNRDTVFVGGIDIFRSGDGGATWSQLSHWTGSFGFPDVHADQHGMEFRPGSSTQMIFSHDGSIDYSADVTGASVAFGVREATYNTTQFYAGALHPGSGVDYFLGGTQDNGSQQFTTPGINMTTEVTGGDGGYPHIDQSSPLVQATSFTGATVNRSTNGGTSFTFIWSEGGGIFINPTEYDNALDILYIPLSESSVRRLGNFGGAFTSSLLTLSPSLGDDISHTRVSEYTAGSTTLFLGTQSGVVAKVTGANTGAPVQTDLTGPFPTGNVSCIELGGSEDTLLVTFSNYGVASVFYSTDGGTSWMDKEGDLPDMPVRWALFNPLNRKEVILATEVGVWATSDITAGSPTWSPSNDGLANVATYMLQYRPSDHTVLAATHGRGMFTSTFTASSQQSTNVNMLAGWNMIGRPLDVDSDSSVTTLYPSAQPNTLFGWSGSYTTETEVEKCLGYWLRYTSATTETITGTPRTTCTIPLSAGWNMIAGPSCDVAVADISSVPAGIIVGTIFGWSGSYTGATTIEQGQGYWVNASSAGTITLSCTAPLPKSNPGLLADNLSEENTLYIRDASGASQQLYFNVAMENEAQSLTYSLPPIPPSPLFDARFSGDYRAIGNAEGEINLQTSYFPVQITASNLALQKNDEYIIEEIAGAEVVGTHILKEGETVVLNNPSVRKLQLRLVAGTVPTAFSVEQNFPNPFNPSTEIQYAIPQPENVVVEIYNAIGQSVRTLVSQRQEAGRYQVTWDATNNSGQKVGSGIYFYHVTAGRHASIKKMLLLK